MRNQLSTLWEQLTANYWFIPAVMVVLAAMLSVMTIALDEGIGRELGWVSGLVYVDSAEGARAVLSTVASSMITVAGTVFSLTMVVLTLASQQFGPLVLAHFMRDRGNQFVLGVFTATFLYCLLVLRTIRGGEDDLFVPHLSVLMGLGLAVASLAVLIYFIHHISRTIQAPQIIVQINQALLDEIDDLFPIDAKHAHTRVQIDADEQAFQQSVLARVESEAYIVAAGESGYLQMIDLPRLLKAAQRYDLIVHVDVLPGQFLFKGQPLARVLLSQPPSTALDQAVERAFVLGKQRTQTQDIEFIVTQLSAMAVRALSPSLNDPYTALMVIDHLGGALCTMLHRQPPSIFRYDDQQRLRVILYEVTFQTLFHTAFDQIRHYGYSDLKIDTRLLLVFKALWDCTEDPDVRSLLRRYATRHYTESLDRLTDSEDEQITQTYAVLLQAFQKQG
jgi:uncharacterized membrane protein